MHLYQSVINLRHIVNNLRSKCMRIVLLHGLLQQFQCRFIRHHLIVLLSNTPHLNILAASLFKGIITTAPIYSTLTIGKTKRKLFEG